MSSPHRAFGYLITTPADGPETVTETRMCCHCGAHWQYNPQVRTGKKRGFCRLCYGLTCGHPDCDRCVPTEQMLENIEAGRPLDYRPIRARAQPIDWCVPKGGIELPCPNTSPTATPPPSSTEPSRLVLGR